MTHIKRVVQNTKTKKSCWKEGLRKHDEFIIRICALVSVTKALRLGFQVFFIEPCPFKEGVQK
jgi:hypothetical protein